MPADLVVKGVSITDVAVESQSWLVLCTFVPAVDPMLDSHVCKRVTIY